jgi:flagella basal body P-ring formation protein FlgA
MTIINKFIAAGMFGLTIVTAHIAAAATPASFVKLSGPQLTLGDVFPDVTASADHVLAPAPEPGKELVLSSSDLLRIARHFNLSWQPSTGREKLVVESSGTIVSVDDVKAALNAEIAKFYPGQSFDIDLNEKKAEIAVPADADSNITFSRTQFDHDSGTFRTLARVGGKEKEFSGRVFILASIPVLKRPLRAGDVIGAEDLTYVDIRENTLSDAAIVDAQRLIGMTPKRAVAAMRTILSGDVTAPLSLKKGDLVTMILNSGSLNLTAQGRSLDQGAIGDIVRIINTSSNRIIEGVITAPQTVTIKTAG